MDLQKDFDKLIDTIKSERKKLEKALRSLSADDIEDYTYHLEAFKTAILPQIQDMTNKVLSWVKTSTMDDLATLEKLCSREDLNFYKFRSLVRKHGENYYCNRYLKTIGFLKDFDCTGLVEPVNAMYTLLLGIYDRCYYLSSPGEVSDDSLWRFTKLFYDMI